jgi:hypothetical protein
MSGPQNRDGSGRRPRCKTATFMPLEDDPLDLENMEHAAEEFRPAILRLALSEPENTR